MFDDPFWLNVVLAVLGDRKARCRDCGEYFADWIDEDGNRLELGRGPKKVARLKQPCACEEIENDSSAQREAGTPPPGQKTVLARRAASPSRRGRRTP